MNLIEEIFLEIVNSLKKEEYPKHRKLYNMYIIHKNYKEKHTQVEEKYGIERVLVYNFLLKNLLDIQEKIEKGDI